jgi:hypothetical protein
MVRVAMRNILPGSIMTAKWLSCQYNHVSLPEEFVEESFAGLQFVDFSCADVPEPWLQRHEI